MIAAARWALSNWKLVAGLAGLVVALWSVAEIRSSLIEQGREECREKVQRAVEQQQRLADENAEIYETGRAEREVEYRYRTREVVRHVPSDSDCDWSPDALRMLNDAITGADPERAGESEAAVSGSPDYRITQPTGDGEVDRDGGRNVPGLPGEARGDDSRIGGLTGETEMTDRGRDER